nr:MAG TPA: hypothetical protein [Caudoviricetes sp.]
MRHLVHTDSANQRICGCSNMHRTRQKKISTFCCRVSRHSHKIRYFLNFKFRHFADTDL